jgi:hypothetical protein
MRYCLVSGKDNESAKEIWRTCTQCCTGCRKRCATPKCLRDKWDVCRWRTTLAEYFAYRLGAVKSMELYMIHAKKEKKGWML